MNPTPIHTLVHIGAGSGGQLPHYQQLNPARLVLIEPLPTLAKALRQATAGMPNAEVWELAVSSSPATNAELTEYNLAQASSLHPATGLNQLFPGIKAVRQHQVATISPQVLMERLQLSPEQPNQLVVEANGEEQAILDSLLEQNQLSLFRHIQVSMPDIALYQNPHNPGELLPKLENHCFDLLEVDNSDPDLPLWQLALNPTKQQLKAALAALQQANTRARQLEQELVDATSRAELCQQQLTKEQAAHSAAQNQYKAALEQNQAENGQLGKQLALAETQIKTQQELHKADKQKLEALLQQAKAEAEQLSKQLAAAETQIKTQQEQHKADKQKLEALLQQAKAEAKQLSEQLATTEALVKTQQEQLQQIQSAHQATADENKAQEQKLKKLAQELADAQVLLDTQKKNLDKTRSEQIEAEKLAAEQASQISTLQEELEKFKNFFSKRKKQHEEAEAKIVELQSNLLDSNKLVSELRQQLQATQNSEAKLSSLEQKMEALLNSQSQQIHQNTNALGQHITKTLYNSTRQLEALMGVQQSLQYGEVPLSYNGWAIGADLALQLVQQVQQHNYDMIIEFGSGTSTLLLARALLNKSINIPLQRHTLEHKRNGTAVGEYIEPTEQDLPQRIVSFEHDKHYYKQTLQNLRQQGLAQVVELIHAPLVDYSEQGSDYLFYDCKGKIKQLAQTLAGREAHILVLVDGPSSTQEQENARYPALPHLLKHLAAHKLDIILDDYHRGGEQQIAEQWRGQLKARSLHFTEASLPSEKGALLLNINH